MTRSQLREAWETYDIVWWNCFDFAIRLAYMLIPDETTGLLGNIQMAIWTSRMHYTYEAHERTRRRSWWETNRIIPFVLGNVLTAVAAAANPATAIT
jgi:hypothetical protein